MTVKHGLTPGPWMALLSSSGLSQLSTQMQCSSTATCFAAWVLDAPWIIPAAGAMALPEAIDGGAPELYQDRAQESHPDRTCKAPSAPAVSRKLSLCHDDLPHA